MDHPRKGVSGNSCNKQREQRVPCHSVDHGSLALAYVPLCLRILFSCLSGVLLATAVNITGCFGRLVGNVVQSFPHLI
jgi:hypothetical protein